MEEERMQKDFLDKNNLFIGYVQDTAFWASLSLRFSDKLMKQ